MQYFAVPSECAYIDDRHYEFPSEAFAQSCTQYNTAFREKKFELSSSLSFVPFPDIARIPRILHDDFLTVGRSLSSPSFM